VEAFPFNKSEWEAVGEAALPIVNAYDDEILHASHFEALREVLAQLRARHGEHPVLLETEADFTSDHEERICLYLRAAHMAADHQLPTLSIRLSLARAFLAVNRSTEARAELDACQEELTAADQFDREEWSALLADCQRRVESA
jgi:thioredoxin-like negative regulator of GroEL